MDAREIGITSHRLGVTVSPPPCKMMTKETLHPPTAILTPQQCHPQYEEQVEHGPIPARLEQLHHFVDQRA